MDTVDPLELKQSVETLSALENLGEDLPAPEHEETVSPPINRPEPVTTPVTQPTETRPTDPPEAVITHTDKPGDEDADFEAKLAAVQPKDGDHPNKKEGIKALKEIASNERSARKELQKEIERLKDENKNARLVTPELEEKIRVADEIIRSVDIERDPEFRQKYDAKIRVFNDKASLIIGNSALAEDIKKFIAENGGPVAVAASDEKMPADVGGTKSEWLIDTILPALPPISRERLRAALTEAIDVREEMQIEIAKAKKEAPERQQKKAEELSKMFAEARDKELGKFGDRAKKWEIPSDAPPEKKAEIEMHNARWSKASAKFEAYLKSGSDPKAVAAMMVNAAQTEYLSSWVDDLQKEIKELKSELADREDRIARLKGAAPRARESNAPVTTDPPLQKALSKVKDVEAIDQFFES